VIPLLYAGAMATEGVAALVVGRLLRPLRHFACSSVGIAFRSRALPLAFLGGPAARSRASCAGAGHGRAGRDAALGDRARVSMNKRGTAFGTFNAVFG
jgi:hypothetical protein